VLYVMARSLGLGKLKLTLRNEERLVGSGSKQTKKKRSHSEAVLRAVLEVGYVTVGGVRYDLSEYRIDYGASTNEACGAEHENCKEESVPFLSSTFYFLNPYVGGASASGTEKANNRFQAEQAKGDAESEAESEDEFDVAVVDTPQFEGVNIASAGLSTVQAQTFREAFDAGKHKRRAKYDLPGRSMPRNKKSRKWTKK
jgi:hypothetical protein